MIADHTHGLGERDRVDGGVLLALAKPTQIAGIVLGGSVDGMLGGQGHKVAAVVQFCLQRLGGDEIGHQDVAHVHFVLRRRHLGRERRLQPVTQQLGFNQVMQVVGGDARLLIDRGRHRGHDVAKALCAERRG